MDYQRWLIELDLAYRQRTLWAFRHAPASHSRAPSDPYAWRHPGSARTVKITGYTKM